MKRLSFGKRMRETERTEINQTRYHVKKEGERRGKKERYINIKRYRKRTEEELDAEREGGKWM